MSSAVRGAEGGQRVGDPGRGSALLGAGAGSAGGERIGL